jgi:hypothetical protein
MTDTELPEIVGLQEIADLLEVGRRTPHAWQYRKLLPPPDYASVNGLRAWKIGTIITWAANTGRIPPSLRNNPAIPGYAATAGDGVVRGGRRAKAENLAALADAGIIPVTESVATAVATNEAAGPGPHARWSDDTIPSIHDAVAAIGGQVDEAGTVRFGV